MKKYVIYVAAITYLLASCKDSEFDFPNKGDDQGGGSGQIIIDTIGVHKFLGDKYFMITSKEQRLLYYAKEQNMYSFHPVALPEGDHPDKNTYPDEIRNVMFDSSNDNYFLGFPNAVLVDGKPMIVAERRVSEDHVNEYSDGVFIRAGANDQWQYTEFFKYAPYGRTFLATRPMIGITDAGKLLVKAQIGVMISDNGGASWTHEPRAFDQLNENDYISPGANMVYHHKFNSMFFATGHRKMNTGVSTEGVFIGLDLNTGEAKEVLRDWVPPIVRNNVENVIAETGVPVLYVVDARKEPDLAAYDGFIVAFSVFRDRIFQFVYAYKPGDTWDDVVFTAAQTTIIGSLSRQNPPGIIYNPVSKRFDLIQSIPYELILHSISVEDLLNNRVNEYGRAQWRNEASLLKRNIGVRGQGMYPVSSLVDVQKGVQRVFINMGDEYPGRSGVFELVRTLNTAELSAFVARRRTILESQDW